MMPAHFYSSNSINQSLPLIKSVFEEHLLCIEIVDFLSITECNELLQEIEHVKMEDFMNLQGKARRIGLPVYEMIGRQEEYFEQAKYDTLIQIPAYQRIIKKLLNLLDSADLQVKIASNKSGEYYYPGIINEFYSTLPLHFDSASKEQKDWFPIKNVGRQFAYVIKLTECKGGETYYYPKRWQTEDEQFFNIEDGYSYDMAVVKDTPKIKIEGHRGTLLLFDSSCYHRVAPVIRGQRITLGGFLGELANGTLVMWG